ncbi:MAG: amidohydrolase family protein [Planctomycetota bacterium]
MQSNSRRARILAALPLCVLLSANGVAPSRGAGPGDPPHGSFAVRCGTFLDGRHEAVHDAWLVVRDGKVVDVLRSGDPPKDLPVVDASDKVVMPGIVAADSELSEPRDSEYNVTPDFLALDGFDFEKDWQRALAAGVTSAYLSPGRNRLISGQGSVVKLGGNDPVARVVADHACLRVNLGASSTQAPPVFEPTYFPTADDPLVPAERQYPSAKISQLATLRRLFAEALRNDAPVGGGSPDERYDPRALRSAARGDLPVRVAARSAAEVQRALAFGEQLGQRVVIEDPAEIASIVDALHDRAARLVLRMPVRLSGPNAGGENRRDRTPTASADNLGIAARAAVPVALAPASGEGLDDILMLAGLAVRHGMSREAALAAITATAADVLGVAERIGSLEKGRDADFLILSGDPLAVGSMVDETWIDGARVYERKPGREMLAIRCARVMTATGTTLRDAVVIVADGRIKAVGEDLAIPYGATIIDLRAQGGVMVPGFIDSESRLGLAGDGTGVPAGNPAQQVAKAIRHDDPEFGAALDSGITSLLVSGADAQLVSGRIAAVKTGASDDDTMVIDPIAGQRFVFDDVAPDAIGRLAAELDKGKKYLETWQAWEKAYADWKAGKTQKPAETASAQPEAKTADDPISGVWTCALTVPQMGATIEVILDLKLSGTTVTGTSTMSLRGRQLAAQPIENGTFENGELKALVRVMGGESQLVARIEGDKLTGKVTAMGQDVDFNGTRTGKPGEAPKPVASSDTTEADGSPKKPKVEEALEPLRELCERKATAVVRASRGPAIEAVVKLMTERKIRFALQDADDAVRNPSMLGKDAPPVVVGPELVMRDRGELVNKPARLADGGVHVAFATGDCLGTQWLPVHAMHAIRWGLDPDTALRAITIEPARAFGIDDRVGSIERGKDADLVVFSGGPFEPTSRLLLVVCNGRVVRDAKDESR